MRITHHDLSKEQVETLKLKDQQIQHELLKESNKVRDRYPFLVKYQDAIGMGILIVSTAGMLLNAWLWFQGIMPAWAVILLSAFWASLLHELEHDLIHNMYFRNQPFWYNFMMLTVYLTRPLTPNSWVRKYIHLHHHKVSGSETDLEERAITNGEKWNFKRFIMISDNLLAFYMRANKYRKEIRRLYIQGTLDKKDIRNVSLIGLFTYFPVGILAFSIWHFFIFYHLINGLTFLVGIGTIWPEWIITQQSWITALVVTLIAPNVLRSFCINFISSNMHYYGDITPGIIHQQCQVMNKWYLFPLHLFCFNFGSTHAIHHFLLRDPFYIRQLTEKGAHRVMRNHGIRFNDMATFWRANRIHENKQNFSNTEIASSV